MARALRPVVESATLRAHPMLTWREPGFTHEIRHAGDRVLYTVSSGSAQISIPLAWSFGSGTNGQTYLFEYQGVMYESRLTFFAAKNNLGLTPGQHSARPKSILHAMGEPLTADRARRCFGCHSIGAVRGSSLHLESIVPGVSCENCHGPGSAHVAAIEAGNAAEPGIRKLSRMTAEQASSLCGQCHRTWEETVKERIRGLNTLRFAPYRLNNSRCYLPTDRRISCVACHNPHESAVQPVRAYDSRCLACHSGTAHRTCPVAKVNCVSCHMPKLEIPGMHTRFTDHQIRIVRAGQPFPN